MAWPNPYINNWSTGDFSTSRTNTTLAGETTIVSSPVYEELYSCRVHADNSLNDSGVHRTQRVWGSSYEEYQLLTGYEYWMGFACRVNTGGWPTGWSLDNGRCILWQINQGPGGPELHLQGDATDDRLDWLGDAPNLPGNITWPRDQWLRIVVNVVRSYNGTGSTRIWHDGNLVYDQSNITNAHSEATQPIVTFGTYWAEDDRPGWDSTIYWDSFRLYRAAIGTNLYDTVMPGTPETKSSVYPDSTFITGINFDMNTLQNYASGTDNWPITWSDDGNQYTSGGDGPGFDGSSSSICFCRVSGNKDSYTGTNVADDPFTGKCLGIISIGGDLYAFRNGTSSGNSAFDQTELWSSSNYGSSWTYRFRWDNSVDFSGWDGFFSPSFCQFGQDYSGARDSYVYAIASEVQNSTWDVQYPGRIHLLRAPTSNITNKSAWTYFSGNSSNPVFSTSINNSQPIFTDNINGTMRCSISYNAYLKRYILITQHVARFQDDGAIIGFYEALEPWGPWHTIDFFDPWDKGIKIDDGNAKTTFFNFSNKWTVEAGTNNFVMVYTGDGSDEWGSVEGSFVVDIGGDTNVTEKITGITFNLSTLRTEGGGSDNWPITWADNDHQYTFWGDGGGFTGTSSNGRVPWGCGRVEGDKDNYTVYDVWGGLDPENPYTGDSQGKCEGIICVAGILYVWNSDPVGGGKEIWRSTDHGAHWSRVVDWISSDFGSTGINAPTFLNFGKNNTNSRDGYVYSYTYDETGSYICGDSWDVQYPGRVHLIRVPANQITTKSAWQVFTGTPSNITWSSNFALRNPVLTDATYGMQRLGVIYVPAANRYLMTAQQVSRFHSCGAKVGIFEAPEPWGPWTLVRRFDPWTEGIKEPDSVYKTTTFFVSPKWWDGLTGVLVYTGQDDDSWGTVEFTLTGDEIEPPPPPPPAEGIEMIATSDCSNYEGQLWPQPLTEDFSWCDDVYTLTTDPFDQSNTVFKLTADGTKQGCDYEEDRDLYKQRAQVVTIDPAYCDNGVCQGGWSRCYVVENGYTYWYGYRMLIPAHTQSYWEQFAQNSDRNMSHHSLTTGGGCVQYLRATSTTNAIEYRANPRANSVATGDRQTITISNAFGRWINVVIRHRVSSSANGTIIVWIDGIERIRIENVVTYGSEDSNNTKVGLYMANQGERPWPFELYLDNYRLARSENTISNAVGFAFVDPSVENPGILIAEANGPYSGEIDEVIQFSSAGSIDQN